MNQIKKKDKAQELVDEAKPVVQRVLKAAKKAEGIPIENAVGVILVVGFGFLLGLVMGLLM